jgi:hypothetical protein
MRIQIYEEELDKDVEVITHTSRNGESFYGLRVWLKTCQSLLDHSTPEDDDRSAVTFWARDLDQLAKLTNQMALAISTHSFMSHDELQNLINRAS